MGNLRSYISSIIFLFFLLVLFYDPLRAFWFVLFGGWVGSLIAAFVVLLISISIIHLRFAIFLATDVFLLVNLVVDPLREFWIGLFSGLGFGRWSVIVVVIVYFVVFILSLYILEWGEKSYHAGL